MQKKFFFVADCVVVKQHKQREYEWEKEEDKDREEDIVSKPTSNPSQLANERRTPYSCIWAKVSWKFFDCFSICFRILNKLDLDNNLKFSHNFVVYSVCCGFVGAVSTTSNLIQPMWHSDAMKMNALRIVYIRWYWLSIATQHWHTGKCTQIWKVHIENWLSFVVVLTIAIDFCSFSICCTSFAFGNSAHKSPCIPFRNDREKKERRNLILA